MPSATPPPGQYTVLRIKRKATEPPLSSLVISDERAAKRRTLRKRGVFRLAETVPHTWRGEGAECDMLKVETNDSVRISPTTSCSHFDPGTLAPRIPLSVLAPLTPPRDKTEEAAETVSVPHPTPSVPRTQYRVVPGAPARDPNLPPRVITNAERDAARNALLFVDATAVHDDPDMAAFLPMLNEYLRLEGAAPPPPQDDEYVYDLYFKTEEAGAGGSVGALLGYEESSPPSTPPDSEPEDEADEDSNDEDYYRNDYPEDEDADEDMEGYEDAYSDGAWSHDSEADRGELDEWEDYR
ncbi:hypothetical protein CC85DRAFT_295907 [Cutaneotrichosporon oleaginosum]|uniref:Probable RNA polymerase II nuclear localization protein SLC7A6OS n=1 Tax=Cutaneotrichosporon oleaginosum TaxID=879819 RepID=A0A0J0XS67_9TREE|nr:uncharacterized protein CC85DRAFT_295907 [Cutaneotrichosporon oleaginosum]KLT43910.1 hypothetical protein CC85DRAFT_295907 [Cutaneotrichosporon oleaginosum]